MNKNVRSKLYLQFNMLCQFPWSGMAAQFNTCVTSPNAVYETTAINNCWRVHGLSQLRPVLVLAQVQSHPDQPSPVQQAMIPSVSQSAQVQSHPGVRGQTSPVQQATNQRIPSVSQSTQVLLYPGPRDVYSPSLYNYIPSYLWVSQSAQSWPKGCSLPLAVQLYPILSQSAQSWPTQGMFTHPRCTTCFLSFTASTL